MNICRGMGGLLVATTLLTCHPTQAAAPKSVLKQPLPAVAERVFDNGLGLGWQDYGWAPRSFDAGSNATIDFSKYGGWIIAKPGLAGRFGGLRIRYQAAGDLGDFLEVRVDSPTANAFPRTIVDASHRIVGADGWTDAFVPMSELNPKAHPFDRIVVRAYRDVKPGGVHVALIGLTVAGPETVQVQHSRDISVSIDCRSPGQLISSAIYGVAFDFQKASSPQLWDLGFTARRWGGNATSRYNWRLGNAWNTASDWFFQNVNLTAIPDFTYTRFLDDDREHKVATALTVPTLGWVARDTSSYSFPVDAFGPQQRTAPEQPKAGNGVSIDGKPLVPGSPSTTSIPAPPAFIAEWVKAIRRHDEGGPRSVQEYILDNEPALWSSTHRDVHPEPVGYDELWDRTERYARAIKDVDPEAIVAGPAEWGWPAYQFSAVDAQAGFAIHPDRLRHGDTPLIPWWLKQIRDYRERTRINLVDILDVHFYPQGKGIGVGTQGEVDSETAALRIRSTRALWDPTYKDESWIGEPVQLIPRLKKWIRDNDPGMGISIGEWNFGAEGDMSGGLAVAEALGRFGQAGITSAYYWTAPPAGTPAYWAFRAFRNYDGKGSHFLEQSIPTTSNDPSVSVFASRGSNGSAVAVLLNLSPDAAANAVVGAEGCSGAVGRVFSYSGGPSGFATAPASSGQPLLLAPYSITVVEYPGAAR